MEVGDDTNYYYLVVYVNGKTKINDLGLKIKALKDELNPY